MNTSVIHLLQEKYPNKTFAVIDVRSATICDSKIGKDIAFSETVVRARKPRSEYSVDLVEFDQELAMFLYIEGDMLYYMPTGYNRYCQYKTNVLATGSVMEDVAQMVNFGMARSREVYGDMKLGETRMFCLCNNQAITLYDRAEATSPHIHVTVQRERDHFQISAEVASTEAEVRIDQGLGYHAMLSFQFPADDLQQSIADKAGNIAYYLN